MAGQFFRLPGSTIVTSEPYSGANGSPIPGFSALVGGQNASNNLQPLQLDASGNLKVSIAAEPLTPLLTKDAADGNTGSAVPLIAIQVAGSDGTNLRALNTTATGILNVIAAQSTASNLLSQVSQPTASALNATVVQGTAANLLSQVSQPTASLLNATVVQGTASNLLSQVSQPTASALNATVVQSSGANLHVNIDNFPATQPISGTVTANQGSANATPWNENLAQVGGSNFSLGQQLATASLPVVLTASQLSTLTPLSSVTVTQGTAANLNATVAIAAAQTLATVTTVSAVTAITNALPAGTNLLGKTGIDQTTNGSTNAVAIIPNSTSTGANSSIASAALEASHVIKASAGRLYQLTGVNTKASAQYIQVFNSTTVPTDGTAPILLAYVPSGSVFSWDFGSIGRYFSTGIAVSNSSTAATKTIGSADCWFNAEYS